MKNMAEGAALLTFGSGDGVSVANGLRAHTTLRLLGHATSVDQLQALRKRVEAQVLLIDGVDHPELATLGLHLKANPMAAVLLCPTPRSEQPLGFLERSGALICHPLPEPSQHPAEWRRLGVILNRLATFPLSGRTPQEGIGASPQRLQLLAIGASTGGPQAIQEMFLQLRKPLPFAVLLVQHMSEGFVQGFADWLASSCAMQVRVACRGDVPVPGLVLVAPQGCHMRLSKGHRVELNHAPPEHGQRPAVSVLFRSLFEHEPSSIVAVLLSGMGQDGAQELKVLRERGCLTIVQAPHTCVVDGMPRAALALGAAKFSLKPAEIGASLNRTGDGA